MQLIISDPDCGEVFKYYPALLQLGEWEAVGLPKGKGMDKRQMVTGGYFPIAASGKGKLYVEIIIPTGHLFLFSWKSNSLIQNRD